MYTYVYISTAYIYIHIQTFRRYPVPSQLSFFRFSLLTARVALTVSRGGSYALG